MYAFLPDYIYIFLITACRSPYYIHEVARLASHKSCLVLFGMQTRVARARGLEVKCSGRPGKGGAVDGAQHYFCALKDALNYGVTTLLIPKRAVLVQGWFLYQIQLT